MDALLKKLNYRQGPVVVLAAPAEFRTTLDAWSAETPVSDVMTGEAGLVLCFARLQAEVEPLVALAVETAADDPVLWVAYPKKTSRRYRSDLSRDGSWAAALGSRGFEPVRQVAIDDDWSALRFRRVEHIRSMRRSASAALSEAGRERLDAGPGRDRS